jgi:hypothetical protein
MAPLALSPAIPGGVPAVFDRMRSSTTIPTSDEWNAALVLWIASIVTAGAGLLLAALLARTASGARAVAGTRRVG